MTTDMGALATPADAERRAGEIDSEAVKAVARALCEQQIRHARRYEKPPAELEALVARGVDYAWKDFVECAETAIAAMPTPAAADHATGINMSPADTDVATVRAEERIAMLKEALMPIFEHLDKQIMLMPSDEEPVSDDDGVAIKVGWLRNARAALSDGGGR